jgi:hypothetical protein
MDLKKQTMEESASEYAAPHYVIPLRYSHFKFLRSCYCSCKSDFSYLHNIFFYPIERQRGKLWCLVKVLCLFSSLLLRLYLQ